MYLLDTNVLSELRKRNRCHRSVQDWMASTSPDELWMSVLMLGEIRKGINQLQRRDPTSASNLEKWLEETKADFGSHILPITTEITEEWGRLNAVRPLPTADSLMAATANVHGLTFVTRDVKALTGSGVKLLNPFEG